EKERQALEKAEEAKEKERQALEKAEEAKEKERRALEKGLEMEKQALEKGERIGLEKTARKMLAKGISIEDVSEFTGFSVEETQSLG
ncbi:MAG: hypothetical protein WCG04_02255, partial [Alphaproteobacteria bacterium]